MPDSSECECMSEIAWLSVWVRLQVCECVRVCGRIGSGPINGNIRARYLNHFIGLTLYCFFARCEGVERKIYNCNLTSVVEARLKVCNDFDTRSWGRGIRRITQALQCCGSLAHYEFLCTTLWESCISMCACVCVRPHQHWKICAAAQRIQFNWYSNAHCEHAKTSASIICRFYTWQKKAATVKSNGRPSQEMPRVVSGPGDGEEPWEGMPTIH